MNVYYVCQHIVTSLGLDTESNVEKILANQSGIQINNNPEWTTEPTPLSVLDREPIYNTIQKEYTFFEKLAVYSIEKALSKQNLFPISSAETLIILSTTKGNIELLDTAKAEKFEEGRINLASSGEIIRQHFKNPNPVLVISNACISGVLALIAGMRKIKQGHYKHIVAVGIDVMSHFVVSGFQSFKSLSPTICKPFDAKRDGLSLGEGVGTILLTSDCNLADSSKIILVNGATANDANHISGPSRTAEGQFYAMQRTLFDWHQAIDFISAHGTATPYNDDMESIAIHRHNLNHVKTNSFKGFFGHTLGAAGIIETALSIYGLQNKIMFGTYGLENEGTVEKITVLKQSIDKEYQTVLKLASGFGGSNAALLIHQLNS